MGATTSEPSRDLVQYAWMYVWHAIVEEEQLIERGVAINGVYKCNAILSFRHVALEAVATLKYATAVGLMVHCGYTEAIELLVKQFKADVNAVSDDLGHTPVAQACAAGDFKLAKVLLQLDGSLHSTLADSLYNPLHEAVLACSTERVVGLLLLDAEYCSSNSGSVQLLAQQDSAGRTPLHLCAALPAGTANRNEVWQLLLSRSDPEALYIASKQTATASDSVELLIEGACVGLPLTAAGCDCATAHAAVAAGHYGCLKRCLAAAPASAAALNGAGQTPLHAVDHSDSSGLCFSMTKALRRALRSTEVLREMTQHTDAAGKNPLQRTLWQPATAEPATAGAATAGTAAAGADAGGGNSASERLCVKCATQILQVGHRISDQFGERLLELAAVELSDATAEHCVALVERLRSLALVVLPRVLRATAMDTGPNAVARLKLLFKCGADAAERYESGCTLLHLIARGPADSRYERCHMQSRRQLLQLLVQHSSATDLLQYDLTSDHSSLLHMAYKYSELVEELVELKVPVGLMNADGLNALVSDLVLLAVLANALPLQLLRLMLLTLLALLCVNTAVGSVCTSSRTAVLSITSSRTAVPSHQLCKRWYDCDNFAAAVAALLPFCSSASMSTDESDSSGVSEWQPLHIVAANAGHAGSAAAVKLLVEKHGASVDADTGDPEERTAAWLVVRHACADSSSSSSSSNSSTSNSSSSSTIDSSNSSISSSSSSSNDSSSDSTQYRLECLQQLIDLGAYKYDTGTDALLYAAAASGNTRMLNYLLSIGLQLPAAVAEDEFVDADADASTPLHAAAQHGRLPM
eukprot:10609-Heterococcus_DN1.PRE.1